MQAKPKLSPASTVAAKLPHIDDLLTLENLSKLAGSGSNSVSTSKNSRLTIPVEIDAGNGSNLTLNAEAVIKLTMSIDVDKIARAQQDKKKSPKEMMEDIRAHITLKSAISELKFI